MYIPKAFEVTDQEQLYDFISAHSFGILVSSEGGLPVGTHLPLLLDRHTGRLKGHFARPNPQWTAIEGQDILVIFHGPHHYISPSWYETNQSVPTWNYTAVHVYGRLNIIHDEDELRTALQELTLKYEAPDSPYRLDAANASLTDGLMKGTVGFELKIERMEGKWKLSQNHSPERQKRVIRALEDIGTDQASSVAEMMKKPTT